MQSELEKIGCFHPAFGHTQVAMEWDTADGEPLVLIEQDGEESRDLVVLTMTEAQQLRSLLEVATITAVTRG